MLTCGFYRNAFRRSDRPAEDPRCLTPTPISDRLNPFLDWVVTVAFYVALHQVEAWFADKGLHFEAHTQRDDWLTKAKELRRGVWPRYKELEFQSRQARYQCASFDRGFVQSRLLVLLEEIEQEMETLT